MDEYTKILNSIKKLTGEYIIGFFVHENKYCYETYTGETDSIEMDLVDNYAF